ncbi:sensor histidine kinase [Bacillus sp. FJAT-49754]|uniref:histidine kinase n=2 Tax=Lederbergia citrea TaxID=2833581 RepID=A0A942UWW0_9BACI|nr:sensor histidine kinase [Lederbergia citrea]MBS4224304.1 sensor histidine kinase [Lederbergia citrea]
MPIYYVMSENGLKAVMGYTLLLLFLVTYRQLYCDCNRFSSWLIVQIGIIVILSVWYNPNNLFMGFFSANFIGWLSNKRQFNRALFLFAAVISIVFIVTAFNGANGNMLYFLPFFAVMIASPFGIRSLNKHIELEKQLDQANEQIKYLIKREERVRIARDLHDTLGHTLSLITLQSQLVQRLAGKNSERAIAEAKQIEMSSRSALRQVRELVSDMRTITVAEELAHMEQILTAAGIMFHPEREADLSHLPLLQQNILGMCLRETGTNIVKHSHAKNCFVIFEKTRGQFTIAVKDDGVGFVSQAGSGNGLRGMKERLALIEGEIVISSDKGTSITMTVPLIRKEEKEGVAL